jgi:hypothetical protein
VKATPLSKTQHLEAARRRRIKFVAEKGAMARLFKKGGTEGLQQELFERIVPNGLAVLSTRVAYDKWLIKTIQLHCWQKHSRNGMLADRWAYFAKIINVVVYEIVSNHELFRTEDWRRIRWFLHLPLDSTVFAHLMEIDPTLKMTRQLKGMTKAQYWELQNAARNLANKYRLPPIWFEAAWAAKTK